MATLPKQALARLVVEIQTIYYDSIKDALNTLATNFQTLLDNCLAEI